MPRVVDEQNERHISPKLTTALAFAAGMCLQRRCIDTWDMRALNMLQASAANYVRDD